MSIRYEILKNIQHLNSGLKLLNCFTLTWGFALNLTNTQITHTHTHTEKKGGFLLSFTDFSQHIFSDYFTVSTGVSKSFYSINIKEMQNYATETILTYMSIMSKEAHKRDKIKNNLSNISIWSTEIFPLLRINLMKY